jgi:hypothetical protein
MRKKIVLLIAVKEANSNVTFLFLLSLTFHCRREGKEGKKR